MRKLLQKLNVLFIAIVSSICFLPHNCYAGYGVSVIDVTTTTTGPTGATNTLASYLLEACNYLGIVLGLIGGIQFALALKAEDAESKARAIVFMVSGVVLISLFGVLQTMGVLK